jgi:hypothetical protein
MLMDYVGSPLSTVNEIQKVLEKDFSVMEKDVNVLLRKFSTQIGIENINSPENRQQLREFMNNNEPLLQDIFQKGDEETRQEVRELYILMREE